MTKTLAGGGATHFDSRTHTSVNTDMHGRVTSFERPGLKATRFRADGRAAHIERSRADGSRMIVNRGFHGERRVEVIRPGGVRVVSMGRRGYVERSFRRGYVSRTYVFRGRTEVRVYRTYTYGRIHYYGYVPRVYYQPAFYGWTYRPWRTPVVYAWGWGPAPWFGFYGGYFAPAPYYPSASLWLTDFLLAENLKLAYENQQAAGEQAAAQMQSANAVMLTPEVKQMIAEEVQQQLAAERAASAQPPTSAFPSAATEAPPPALDPRQRIFVVSTSMDVAAITGDQTCALTPGDIIERTGRTATDDGKIGVSVLSSKAGDCPVDLATAIDVSTLQDMHNDFREQISAGMAQLASNQGRGSLPAAPAANPRPVEEGQAPATSGTDDRSLVAGLNQDADQTEAQVGQALNSGQ